MINRSISSLVAEKLWEMCFHLVGPEYVAMDARDLQKVLDCITALRTLAAFNCEFGHGSVASRVIAEMSEASRPRELVD